MQTLNSRFFLPPEERSILAKNALRGEGFAARRLLMHYRLVEWNPKQAHYWASVGAKAGDETCQRLLSETQSR